MQGDLLSRVAELVEARANLEAARKVLRDFLDAQGDVGPFRQAAEELERIAAGVARVEGRLTGRGER